MRLIYFFPFFFLFSSLLYSAEESFSETENFVVLPASTQQILCGVCTYPVSAADIELEHSYQPKMSGKLKYYCPNKGHDGQKFCKRCIEAHLEIQILEGFADVPLLCCSGDHTLYKSERTFYMFPREFVTTLVAENPVLSVLYSANVQKFLAIESGLFPCTATADCPGMMKRSKKALCPVCDMPYQKIKVPFGTRYCTKCTAFVSKDGGCDVLMCGHCKNKVKWKKCKDPNLCIIL